ncbi:MAG: hypothetical protein K6E51_14360 [Treponema sp.]|nr:hypothetical protein [Treponema sp.]
MGKSKLDQMRAIVKKGEKAQAKLTKRDLENIENGKKALRILNKIETKTDDVLAAIADVYGSLSEEKADDAVAQVLMFLVKVKGVETVKQNPQEYYEQTYQNESQNAEVDTSHSAVDYSSDMNNTNEDYGTNVTDNSSYVSSDKSMSSYSNSIY